MYYNKVNFWLEIYYLFYGHLEIITAPDPILKKKTQHVESVDDNIREIMDNMFETMYHDKGVGLGC